MTSPFTCASCESTFDWPPLFYRNATFCCAGCAAGGPCSCSYDRHDADARNGEHVPMVAHEWERLTVEAAMLRRQLALAMERRHEEFGIPRDESKAAIPVWEVETKEHRLRTVEDVLNRAEVVPPGPHPVVGALVTLQSTTGELVEYRIEAPGEDDPTLGRVPIDSPFGRLLSRAEVGSSFIAKAPSGARRMTVVAISYVSDGAVSERAPALAAPRR